MLLYWWNLEYFGRLVEKFKPLTWYCVTCKECLILRLVFLIGGTLPVYHYDDANVKGKVTLE